MLLLPSSISPAAAQPLLAETAVWREAEEERAEETRQEDFQDLIVGKARPSRASSRRSKLLSPGSFKYQ